MSQEREALLTSLRRTLAASNPGLNGSLAFAGGTEYGTNFLKPPQECYNYHPLPEVAAQPTLVHSDKNSPTSTIRKDGPLELWHPKMPEGRQGKHLISRSMLFPRLAAAPEAVMAKMQPVLQDLIDNCSSRDKKGTLHLHNEQFKLALIDTHVFLTQAEVDALMSVGTRNPHGEINWKSVTDRIGGKVPDEFTTTSSGYIAGRPPLPSVFEWPADQVLSVTLRLRPDSMPFEVPPPQMQEFAKQLTAIRREHSDAEKVHSLMRHQLLQDLVVGPARPGHPDYAFRDWLASNGVLSVTQRDYPGPVPPEVYDVFDQIIYSLGVPVVMSSTMTLTALGGSMRHTHG